MYPSYSFQSYTFYAQKVWFPLVKQSTLIPLSSFISEVLWQSFQHQWFNVALLFISTCKLTKAMTSMLYSLAWICWSLQGFVLFCFRNGEIVLQTINKMFLWTVCCRHQPPLLNWHSLDFHTVTNDSWGRLGKKEEKKDKDSWSQALKQIILLLGNQSKCRISGGLHDYPNQWLWFQKPLPKKVLMNSVNLTKDWGQSQKKHIIQKFTITHQISWSISKILVPFP